MTDMLVRAQSPVEFFKEHVEAACTRQRLAVSEAASFYVVNMLAGFARIGDPAPDARGSDAALGVRLARETFHGLAFGAEGLRLIRDEEFTSRFLEVGQPEVDELIGVYNRMVDHLRDELPRDGLREVLLPGARGADRGEQLGGRRALRHVGIRALA